MMQIEKRDITNLNSYLISRIALGLGIFGAVWLGYQFLIELSNNGLFKENSEAVFIFAFFAFFVIFLTQAYIRYEGITTLYTSDFGIHSKRIDIKWQDITKISWKVHYSVPVLYIKYSPDDEEKVLKTTLPMLEERAEKSYKKIWEKWVIHKNT